MKYLLPLLLLLLANPSQASTLRCAKGIVSLGDRTAEVRAKCGQPAERSVIGYSSGGDLLVEEWFYPRSGGMLHFLRFEGGRLTRIESKRS